MRLLLTCMVMVTTACGTMEGDVNVEKPKTEIPVDEQQEKEIEVSPKKIERNNEETKINETAENGQIDTKSIADNNDPSVEVNVEVNVNMDKDEAVNSIGKLSYEMTKSEVLEIFPDPLTVENHYLGTIRWHYDSIVCAKKYSFSKCYISFDDDLLISTTDVKSEYLDITSF